MTSEPLLRPRRKRRRWLGWVIALVVIVVILVIAWCVGDRLARDYAKTYVHDKLVAAFHLPADYPIDVTIGEGSLIAQAIGGSIDSVTAHIANVPVGELQGDVWLTATHIPLDPNQPTKNLHAVVTVDETNIAKLKSFLSGVTVDSIAVKSQHITFASSLSVFGFSIPVSVALTPSAKGGQLVFSPDTITVNGADVSISDLRSGALGAAANAILPPQSFCVAQYLPKAIVLSDADVVGTNLVLKFSAQRVALGGPGFSTNGSC